MVIWFEFRCVQSGNEPSPHDACLDDKCVLQKVAISRCDIVIPKRKLKIKCQHFRFKSFDNLLGLSLVQSLYTNRYEYEHCFEC